MRGRAAGVCFIIVALLTSPLRAEPRKPELSVEEASPGRGRSSGIVLRIHNPLPFPITVLLESGRLENLQSNKKFPLTAVIEPQQRVDVARLTPIRADRRTSVGGASFSYRAGRAGARHDDRFVYALPFEAGC